MTYAKSVYKFVGNKDGIAAPKEEWKVILDYHEPLVTLEVFEFVSAFGWNSLLSENGPSTRLQERYIAAGAGILSITSHRETVRFQTISGVGLIPCCRYRPPFWKKSY